MFVRKHKRQEPEEPLFDTDLPLGYCQRGRLPDGRVCRRCVVSSAEPLREQWFDGMPDSDPQLISVTFRCGTSIDLAGFEHTFKVGDTIDRLSAPDDHGNRTAAVAINGTRAQPVRWFSDVIDELTKLRTPERLMLRKAWPVGCCPRGMERLLLGLDAAVVDGDDPDDDGDGE